MLDLFGFVAISTTDVELWLDNLPNFNMQTSYNRRNQYAKFYDLASIISAAKLNGSFSVLEKKQTDFIERRQISHFQTQYAPTQAELDLIANAPCPAGLHTCTKKTCNIRIAIARTNRNARYYAKKNGKENLLRESTKPVDLKTLT